MDVIGKAGLGVTGAWGPGDREWELPMKVAVSWKEVDGFKGFFGDFWEYVWRERGKHDGQACSWVAGRSALRWG